MIWLITLFLLGIAAWLILNGINEKQWVDAHQHDDKVASDRGLFASFTDLAEGDGDDKVGNVISNVKKKASETSSMVGEKIGEARESDTAAKLKERTAGIRDRVSAETKNEDGLFNKVRNSVASGVEKVGKQVDEKIVNRKS